MILRAVTLHHVRMPLVHFFETSFGRVGDKETVIVRAEADDGTVGYGEAPAAALPGFSYETVGTVWHALKDFLVPALKGKNLSLPLQEHWKGLRGHPMARAGIESAVADLLAKSEGLPLYRRLGGGRDWIPSGISLGIEDSIDGLLARVDEARRRGYRRIKVKIKPGWDLDVLAAIRKSWPDLPLTADANGAYSIADLPLLEKLDGFRLLMLEQPLDFEDLAGHVQVQKRLRTPVCLDEGIRSPTEARGALDLGACRIINIKPARVGGPSAALRLQELCAARGVPAWCGGLLETGIGRAHNVAVATLPGFTMPGDLSPSERYYDEDLVDPPVTMDGEGRIRLREEPGLGYTVVESRLERRSLRRERVLG